MTQVFERGGESAPKLLGPSGWHWRENPYSIYFRMLAGGHGFLDAKRGCRSYCGLKARGLSNGAPATQDSATKGPCGVFQNIWAIPDRISQDRGSDPALCKTNMRGCGEVLELASIHTAS